MTRIRITRFNRWYYIWKTKRKITYIDKYIAKYMDVVGAYLDAKDVDRESYDDAVNRIFDAYTKRDGRESFLHDLRAGAIDSIEV